MLAPGSRVDHYRILAPLGRGGMGEVWRAVDERLGREVALKTIAAGLDEAAFERFSREAETAARLRHPAIVAVYDVAKLPDGRPAIAYELVEGESLHQRITRAGPLPPREAARVVRELAEGLAVAHAAGVVHRDLKPANVLIERDGRARLTDFGLARDQAHQQSLTATGETVGTPAFMAPEQAVGDPVGPPADIYGLGAILYQPLAGRPPFSGGSVVEMLHRVVAVEPEPPGGGDAAIEAICRRAMAKRPADRFPSAEALGRALAEALASDGSTIKVPELRTASDGAGGAESAGGEATTIDGGAPGRLPVVLWVVAGIVMLLGMAAGIILGGGLELPPATSSTPPPSGDVPGERPAPPIGDAARAAEARRAAEAERRAAEEAAAAARIAGGWIRQARERRRRRDLTGAIEALSRAIDAAPERAEAWFERGKARFANGENEAALEDLARAEELDPKIEHLQCERATAQLALRRLPAAIASATAAIERDPSCASPWMTRAHSHFRQGDAERAIADYDEAIRLRPNVSGTYSNRGVAHAKRGDLERAIADFDRAIELAPDDPKSWRDRSVARTMLGQRDEAIADLERYLELAPSAPDAAQARQRLDELRRERDGR